MKFTTKIALRRLLPKDSKIAAGIFSRCNPKNGYFNLSKLCEVLEITEKTGVNISIGLYYKDKLVGFIIAFKEISCSVLDLLPDKNVPPTYESEKNCLFFVNISVEKKYRSLSSSLIYRFFWLIKNKTDLKHLELHCLCNDKCMNEIVNKKKLLKRIGLEFNWSVPFGSDEIICMHWISLKRYEKKEYERRDLVKLLRNRRYVNKNDEKFTIGTIQNFQNWSYLEQYWDELLDGTPGAHVFQEYAFLRLWWMHLGWSGQLYIVVVLRNGIPVSIAPMQIIRQKWFKKTFRVLTYVGLNMEMDRLTILCNPKYVFAIDQTLEYLKDRQQDWDLMTFFEQSKDSTFVERLKSHLTGRGFWVTCLPGPECARVGLEDSWENYLKTKSRNFRKSVRLKEGAIRKAGMVRFEYDSSESRIDGIEKYCMVEKQSWKANVGLGLGKTASHRSFYHYLMRHYMAKDCANFAILYLDDLPISASFGVSRNNTFYSLHICHDERFSSFSPGFVLTALELKRAFNDKKYFIFDFLGGYLSNKSCFATEIEKTESVFVAKKNLIGSLFYFFNSKVKTFVKKCLNKYGVLQTCIRWHNSVKNRF
jgi:CelD/BcsL family acetyltransferase involved in cellulose biosynthesis